MGTDRRNGVMIFIRRIYWIVVGTILMSGPTQIALAEDEAHFKDEAAGLSVWFPSPPTKEPGAYDVLLTDHKTLTVPAVIYSSRDESNSYSVTVANLKDTAVDYPNAIELAVKAVRRLGDVKLDLETSVAGSACGRDLTVADRDGGQSIYALFFQAHSNHTLYVFQAKSLSPATVDEGAADALRFQQSVDFVGPASAKEAPETDDDRRWERYFYYKSRFSMRFPSQPTVSHGTYETAGGVKVNTVVYTVRQDTGFYRVTIADLWHTPADGLDAINQAVQLLGRNHRIASVETVNIQGGQCGRDLKFSDRGHASSISTIVFPTVSHWLYIIDAQAASPNSSANAADLARFRRSLLLYWKLDGSSAN
jgi:hypothetical protein